MSSNAKFYFMTAFTFAVIISRSIEVNGVHTETAKDKDTEMESINGTNNFRIYGKNGSDNKPWFDGRGDIRHIHCVRPGKCEELKIDTCLGSKIPYNYTSLDLTDSFNQEQTEERLHNYQALKHVPKCWAVVQPLICAVFVPKCDQINNRDMVYLPSLEMCKLTLEPCRVLYNTSYFPEFLRCNETLFPSKCNNDVRDMKFNGTGQCLEPLVPAESSSSYYKGIEGCGVQCEDPLYTDDEHRQIHKLVGWGASLCLFSNLFVIATFFIDWQNANKYPALIVFYINLCFLISCLGWIAQFTPGSREDIVCRKDGTLRHSEPSAGENLSCIVVFVLVYYFLTAAMVWFVFLTYAWHLKAVGNVQDRINKKGSYFHLVAWSLPLVLTITTMALSEVDGNSTVGVCFVGYINHPIRAALLLGPLCGVILIGGFFIVRGMVMLFALKNFANDIKSTSASNKIHLIIVRMGMCAILTFVFILVTITCHLNEFRNSSDWSESLRKYIICKISATYTDDHKICKIENRPSVAMMQLHLLCLFGSGIVMSSWCWTPSSIDTWRRYIRKKCGRDVSEEIKMQKHKVIAQTWAKRKEFDDKGRLSITLYNTRTDPVGLNFDVNDLNSSATNEISSTWANYLPQFVKRRFALTGAATNSSSHGPRKSSVDSEISVCFRHVSVESRRNSVDSQMSLKIAEMKTQVASRSRSSGHHAKHTKNRNRRRNFFPTARKFSNRRESSTSVESQVIALKKTTYSGNNQKVDIFAQSAKNMKRRSASAGLVEPEDISNFLSKNFPFLNTTSDEETSRASFKIQDSRLDVVVRQRDFSEDDDDDDCKVVEYHTDDDSIQKQNKLEDILNHIQTSSSFDNIISRNSKERFDSASRNSKNSIRSRKSNRRHSTRRNNNRKSLVSKSTKKDNTDKIISDLNVSCTSFASELDLPNATQSSYSGISCGKTQSRNSKTSCDVGIQTNAIEIATQTMSSYNNDLVEDTPKTNKRQAGSYRNGKTHRKSETLYKKNEDFDDDSTSECNQLLPTKPKASIVNYNNNMSESEKLQKLLLPE